MDVICLTPVRPLTAKQIRTLRRREKASQAVSLAKMMADVEFNSLRRPVTLLRG
jgi:hypothetical protein